jgi:class 3 adenylate cyclase
MALAEGDVVGGYRIVRVVGRGGMGVVYLADDVRLGRKVALKVLTTEAAEQPSVRDRFLGESRMAASLDHPNILPIYEAGEADGRPFIAMRYVPGLDLDGLIRRDGPLSLERAIVIVDQVASALDAAHEAGLIHRDVKPGNILVAAGSKPGSEHAYLSDFGLTKHAEYSAQITRSGQLMGSVGYVAPEQIENRPIDRRADVYSLGCVVYECLAGAQPYPRDTDMATLFAHVQAPPPSLAATRPELPQSVDAVIAKALAKDPDERYATAGELAKALAGAAAPDAAERHLTRGFLFADLRGYTAFVEARGDTAAAGLLEVYRRLVRDVVRRFGGAEIKTEGDSFYVVFPSASDAVRCGLAITAAAATASAEHPERPIRVGVGIHAGESTETAEGYVGSAVNIAARICAQAAPGEVLVSDTVRSLTRTSGEIGFTTRGRKHLKGIAEPVAVFAASSGHERSGAALPSLDVPSARRNMRRAAVAVPLVLLLALGGALAMSSAFGPPPSAAPSAIATSAGPSVAALPSVAATSTAYPTAAELTLLGELPSVLQATCVRGRGRADLIAAGFTGTVAASRSGSGSVMNVDQEPVLPIEDNEASLLCRPTAGASGAWFIWYNLKGGTDPYSVSQIAVGDIGTHFGTPEGECAKPPARGSWRSSRGASGEAVCLNNNGPGGQPWIYWSFGNGHVLAAATAPIGQYQVLYDWWQALTPFLQ